MRLLKVRAMAGGIPVIEDEEGHGPDRGAEACHHEHGFCAGDCSSENFGVQLLSVTMRAAGDTSR